MDKEQIQEYTLRITRANKSELVVVVYDLAIYYLEAALKAYDSKDYELFSANARYANKCVGDLLGALDYDYELSFSLMRIYAFVSKQISLAPIKKDRELLDSSRRMLEKLRKSFEEVAKADDTAPLMSNTQEVYAGFTYGKGSLNENIGGVSNRGFTV
ncbi:MAG: flagellar protein FliS [Lachnospiraceae bacterium]|nr:flagellar protein FliS [Lachnospiraceae bacterium]